MNEKLKTLPTCEQVLAKLGIAMVEYCKKNFKYQHHLRIKGQVSVKIDEQEYATYVNTDVFWPSNKVSSVADVTTRQETVNSKKSNGKTADLGHSNSEACSVSLRSKRQVPANTRNNKKKSVEPKNIHSLLVQMKRDAENNIFKPDVDISGSTDLNAEKTIDTCTIKNSEHAAGNPVDLHSEGVLSLSDNMLCGPKAESGSQPDAEEETKEIHTDVSINKRLPETLYSDVEDDFGDCDWASDDEDNTDCGNEVKKTREYTTQSKKGHAVQDGAKECCEQARGFETVAMDTAVQDEAHLTEEEEHSRRCLVCGKQFDDRFELSDHVAKDHKDNCPCFQCEKVFSSYGNFVKHYERTHLVSEIQLTCEQCGKIFETKKRYMVHMKYHKTHRDRHVCDLCGKSYISKAGLEVHTLSHTGEKPFPCALCGKKFRSHGMLGSHHLHSHTDGKPWMCDVCGVIFKTKNRMLMHKKHIHSANPPEKKHECKQCGKRFLRPNCLHRHVATHTDIRNFVCDLCGKAFKRSSHVKAHREGVHKLKRTNLTTPQKQSESAIAVETIVQEETVLETQGMELTQVASGCTMEGWMT